MFEYCFVYFDYVYLYEQSFMENRPEKITKEEQAMAASMKPLFERVSEKIISKSMSFVRIRVQGEQGHIDVPGKVFSMLQQIISHMADGRGVALIPSDAEISTQRAAELLHMSRPHMVKLLEEGEIPYRKVGTHRRVLMKDVMRYEARLQKQRAKQLAFLAKQAQELGFGNE